MRGTTRNVLLCITLLFGLLSNSADAACVVPGHSYFRIHVGTSGLFGGFAHEHLIEAQAIEGCATIDSNNLVRSSIKLVFKTADIRVIDPKESEKDRAQVQKTMETQVLQVAQFPEVTFESTSIETGSGSGNLRVHGNLTIRGKTLPVVIPLSFVPAEDGMYRSAGKFNFKQTSFDIKPIQLAGGTVKVKDELQTEFEILLK